MYYSNDVKKRLDDILKAFKDYIDGQSCFDIVYSPKIGYIKFLVDQPGVEEPEVINTPKDLLGILFNEIINDVRFSPDNPQKGHIHLTLTEYEEAESRLRITTILEQIEGGGAEYVDFLNEYIKDYQKRCSKSDDL